MLNNEIYEVEPLNLADTVTVTVEVGNRSKTMEKYITAAEEYLTEYPDCTVTEAFAWDLHLAERQDAPCKNCKGYPCQKTGSRAGFIHEVKPNCYGELTVKMKECEYYKQMRKAAKIEKQFERANIPKRYANLTWADYKVDADNELAVKRAAAAIENPRSMYFYGGIGAGKTFLASLMAKDFANAGKSVIFLNLPKMLNQLRNSIKSGNQDEELKLNELLNALKDVEILVLDDFGAEMSTEWGGERIFEILNDRYEDMKVTVLTSNYELPEILERMNAPKNGKPNLSGTRIVSRLYQDCVKTRLKGEDRRLMKK